MDTKTIPNQGGRSRRIHSAQFKREAVEQCLLPGMSLANVARQRGLHPNLLSRWVRDQEGASISKLCKLGQNSVGVGDFVPVRVESRASVSDFCAVPAITSGLSAVIECNNLRVRLTGQVEDLATLLNKVLR